jgi:ribosomal-protein-alanine N-acetyltransferase
MTRIAIIRTFEIRDLPGVLRIERECFQQDAWPREAFLEYARTVPNLFLVAGPEGIGSAGYTIARLTRHGGEIASLAVRRSYRKKGVATALLRAAIRKLRRAGVKAVWLTTRRENAAAIQLYQKLGFVRTRTVPNYYRNRSPGWRMRLRIE